MKNGRLCCLVASLTLSLAGLSAESRGFSFAGLDLSGDNRLLFRAESGDRQHTVFVSRLTDLALQQLTAFPERMALTENGRTLLVWNRFGAVRIPALGGLPQPLRGFPSFAAGNVPVTGRSVDLAASADGRWILYMEPVGPAYGNLVLLDAGSGGKRVVSERVELPARDFPARWSPDSRLFVYAKGGRLFYYSLGAAPSAPVDERYRQIGEGKINAMFWGQRGDFFYVRGNTLYLVQIPALYTRTVYGDFLPVGSVAGTIPLDFDPDFDRFWVAPDSRSILFVKGGKHIFYYPLAGDSTPLPYVMIPGGAVDINVLWSSSGLVTIMAVSMTEKKIMTWRIITGDKATISFAPLETPPAINSALSPDGTKALFWGETGAEVWNYLDWEPLGIPKDGPVYFCLWNNSEEFTIGGDRQIERISVAGDRRLVCLSDAVEYGFEDDADIPRILAESDGEWFITDGRSPWAEIYDVMPRKASQASGRYRVFIESRSSGPYENIPMIRNVTATGTTSLASAILLVPQAPKSGGKRAALCFDLYDDDAGLCQTLDALNRFGVKATFFMNGDFIRGNPAAAKAIADAGHEAASLFYAPIDLSASRYRVSSEYIVQGLVRNEDDYYEVTGKELSPIWHTPFYRTSAEISAASAVAGYRVVDRDFDPMDWISRDEARKLGVRQYSAPEMIERIMAAKLSDAVIPIRLGQLPGGRDDYLYLYIEVLLDALVRAGYDLTPVSAVIK
jgi:peptidoglycan/xylan/chitin deacetylase (PgdA/CDA1 family)